MEELEKVERLRERANVSYEEAKAALDQCGGDLLDAIVLLERQGKVRGPGQSTYSTEYDEQTQYVKVREKVEEQEKSAPSFGRSVGGFFRSLAYLIRHTVFVVTRYDKVLFTMPTMLFALLLFFFWEAVTPVIIIALFFGVRYSFEGEVEPTKANTILNKAGDFADDVRDEFMNKSETARNEEAQVEEVRNEYAQGEAVRNEEIQ